MKEFDVYFNILMVQLWTTDHRIQAHNRFDSKRIFEAMMPGMHYLGYKQVQGNQTND
jgi:hypothetical protein